MEDALGSDEEVVYTMADSTEDAHVEISVQAQDLHRISISALCN